MINIRINGQAILTEEGKSIYEVALENGMEIPSIFGANSKNNDLCLVNIVGYEGLADAFRTKVKEGMIIYTDSRSVNNARKLLLELLLSDHYADCYEPCKLACPLGVEIQNILSLIQNGMLKEAYDILKKELPSPMIVCSLCEGFCEQSCRRVLLDKKIEIRKIIDFLVNYSFENRLEVKNDFKEKNGKKVAIIGAGISGLTCGYFLSEKGYQVDIYDKEQEAGGVFTKMIPDFVINKDFVSYETEYLLKSGINFIPNSFIDSKVLEKLVKDYDAVYIATGLQKDEKNKVVNINKIKNGYEGSEFLEDYRRGEIHRFGKNNIVYGNGKIAINSARIIKRADFDVFLYLTDKSFENSYDLQEAIKEGVKVLFNKKIIKLKKEKNKVKKIVFKDILTGKTEEKKADFFINATESISDFDFLKKYSKKRIRLNVDGTLRIAKVLYSGIDNIFIGGSLRLGKNISVVTAAYDGKIAANSIDKFIRGDLSRHSAEYKFYSVSEINPEKIYPEYYKFYKKIPKNSNQQEPLEIKNFTYLDLGFSKEEAINEAKLCLECGCINRESCKLKKYANQYHVNIEYFEGERNKYPIDNRHPFIVFDANKCVLCGNCVEECGAIGDVLAYRGKGFNLSVRPLLGKSLTEASCLSCGKCIEVCPTSAFYEKNVNYSINNTYNSKEMELNCGLCGLGCEIKATVQNGKILKINPSGKGFNKNNLCFEGKFGWQVFEKDNRINVPLVRLDKQNDWKEDKQEWQKADLHKLAKDIKKRLENLGDKAIFVDPTVTLEEVLLLKDVAKNIGAEIYSFYSEKKVMNKFYNTIYTEKKYIDLQKADVLVLIGEIPLVLKTLMKDFKKMGKKIILINQGEGINNRFADIIFDSESINSVLEKIIEYNNLECSCKDIDCDCNDEDILPVDLPPKTMFVYNKNRVSEQTIANILRLSYQICSEYKEGSGIFEISDFINTKGFIRLGIKKSNLKIFDFVLLYGAMPNSEQLKWLEKSKYVISVDTHLDNDNIADVFIPKPDYLSIDGIAIADGSKIVKFKNVKNERFFQELLKIFKDADFIEKEKSKTKYWNKKAEELVKNLPSPISYEENYLSELIENIDTGDEQINRFYPVYYFQINKLKNKTNEWN